MADTRCGELHAERFLASALQQFRNLAASPGVTVSRQISLAGRTVRLEVSAGAMERAILPALAHLAEPGTHEPDLVLYAWDSESTGAPWLEPGWSLNDYRPEGYVSGFNDSRFHTAMQLDPLVLRVLDMARGRGLYWTPAARKIPYWDVSSPLRPLLQAWMKRIGLVGVHGGAVGLADGGLFLAGAGGRGKSNVALACLNSELFYASDDFCFLSQSPHWCVHSLYCTGKIAGADLVRHPHLRGAESNPDRLDREKAVFFLNEKFGDRLIRAMPLRAIVLPRVIARGPSEIVPISPAVAQGAIAISMIEFSRWVGKDTLMKAAELVRDLPCYELQVGASISEVPALLANLLNDLRRQRSPRVPP
jgi:hypothetical protein